jgi:hypothetical protein
MPGLMNKKDRAMASIIAVEIGNSHHGDFLKNIFTAWLRADNHNKMLMEPLVLALISKYHLMEEYALAIKEHLKEYLKE